MDTCRGYGSKSYGFILPHGAHGAPVKRFLVYKQTCPYSYMKLYYATLRYMLYDAK